jgi:hypothetical protein
MPEIHRFDPGGCGFPSPLVPLLPEPRWRELGRDGADTVPPALLDGPRVRRFARARYALHAACHAAGLGPGDLLLAPAYHCRTMLDPALALGAGVALYGLHEDLRPDLASIEVLLAEAGGRAKALLVPHYFGIEQPRAAMEALAGLCGRHGLLLIEDCAHAWMVAQQRAAQAFAPGRVVVASAAKYFACPDGGMLWADPAQLPPPGRAPGTVAELKAAAQLARRRTSALPASAPGMDSAARGTERRECSERPSGYYDPALEELDCLAVSRWLILRARPHAIAQRRRARYRQWLDAVAPLAHARALAPALPEDCAPYMFPLLISRPDPDFFRLKQAGLPIWRWDDMAVSGCAVAGSYRTRLLQLPCHQGLGDAQMGWMLGLVREVLS